MTQEIPVGHAAPLVSVVIPAHNAAKSIGAQLDALVSQESAPPFEVIVVDNDSTDGTAEVAAQYTSSLGVRVISARARRSASYARNVGASHAVGEFIVFIDSDDMADSALLATFASNFDGHDIIGGTYEESRLNPLEIAAWREPLSPGHLPVIFERFPYFLMGNVAIRRSLFERLGGLDEELVHGGEEVDLSLRAHLAGHLIACRPESVVYHRHRTTITGLARQFYDFGRASSVLYDRYRKPLMLERASLGTTAEVFGWIALHAVDIVRGRRRRGRWMRQTSYFVGEIVQNLRLRVWHL
jgi:glycosyltransferase involved in cell wall biosynthesis